MTVAIAYKPGNLKLCPTNALIYRGPRAPVIKITIPEALGLNFDAALHQAGIKPLLKGQIRARTYRFMAHDTLGVFEALFTLERSDNATLILPIKIIADVLQNLLQDGCITSNQHRDFSIRHDIYMRKSFEEAIEHKQIVDPMDVVSDYLSYIDIRWNWQAERFGLSLYLKDDLDQGERAYVIETLIGKDFKFVGETQDYGSEFQLFDYEKLLPFIHFLQSNNTWIDNPGYKNPEIKASLEIFEEALKAGPLLAMQLPSDLPSDPQVRKNTHSEQSTVAAASCRQEEPKQSAPSRERRPTFVGGERPKLW